jgi:hypothetical protein
VRWFASLLSRSSAPSRFVLFTLGDKQLTSAGLAAEKHVYKQIIYAERGTILDANNEVLAHNACRNCGSRREHLNDRDALIDLVSQS